MDDVREYSHRYRQYCRITEGGSPRETLARDRERWPGGCMCGFTLWIQQKWTEWGQITGWPPGVPPGPDQHRGFDRWLETRCVMSTIGLTYEEWCDELGGN